MSISVKNNNNMAQQIKHWVHDEQACVTVQRIAQTFNVSWSVASSLLKEVPEQGKSYSLTTFGQSTKAASTATTTESDEANDASTNAFELVKCKLGDTHENDKPDESLVWYALALDTCEESLHTSHERDRSQFQDDIMAQFSVTPPFLQEEDSMGLASSILVSKGIQQRLAASRAKQNANDDNDVDNEVNDVTFTNNKARAVVPKKKTVTTARNFFAARSTTTNASSSSSSGKNGEVGKKATTTSSQNANKLPSKGGSKGQTQSSTLSFQPQKGEDRKPSVVNSKTTKKQDEEKENVRNESKSSKVGNADDFVGDADDEDDDVDDDDDGDNMDVLGGESGNPQTEHKTTKGTSRNSNKSKAPSRAKVANRPYSKSGGSFDDDGGEEGRDNDEEPCNEKPNEKNKQSILTTSDGTKHRRRRKRMVEKTFTDENGYLHTETQAVWEDVPSDEEETTTSSVIKRAQKAKKSSAPPKALKQGSILGFFSKK